MIHWGIDHLIIIVGFLPGGSGLQSESRDEELIYWGSVAGRHTWNKYIHDFRDKKHFSLFLTIIIHIELIFSFIIVIRVISVLWSGFQKLYFPYNLIDCKSHGISAMFTFTKTVKQINLKEKASLLQNQKKSTRLLCESAAKCVSKCLYSLYMLLKMRKWLTCWAWRWDRGRSLLESGSSCV